ncbi:putative pectinesterase 29 [Citrus sinensis]|nr:putative pectinesterase 29 [Citrus sinensis]
MPFARFLFCLCVLLFTCHLGTTNAKSFFKLGSRAASCQIVVDHSGHGNFSSIQSAIDNIPSNNKNWVCIFIKAGIYREKVRIPYEKPFIILKGVGKRKTQIIWDDHESLAASPTFASFADNVVVKCMSFVNSYNSPRSDNKNPRMPAVAAMVAGDKTAFYRCGFSGVQDTLWDDQGRHYFDRCTIEGAVDFIFGGGQSIYENCVINVVGSTLQPGLHGFITAQGRTNPNDANGFVFKGGIVMGTGSTLLGRPWRGYARVLFYSVNLTNVVDPKGWEAWNSIGHE